LIAQAVWPIFKPSIYTTMKPYLLICCAATLFFACKKDGANNGTTKKDLLTKAPWIYESGGVDLNGDAAIDLPLSGLLPGCLLDNKGIFNADGSGLNDEGNSKCDPQTTPFTWSFVNNETQLAISGNGFAGLSGNFKIRTLTDAVLSFSKDTTSGLISGSVILNLKH
jgi:hypothetical protein